MFETQKVTNRVLTALRSLTYPVDSPATTQTIPFGDGVRPILTPEQTTDGRYGILYVTEGGTGGSTSLSGSFDAMDVTYLVACFGDSRSSAEWLSGQVRRVFLERNASGWVYAITPPDVTVVDRRFSFRGGVAAETESLYAARDGYVVALSG